MVGNMGQLPSTTGAGSIGPSSVEDGNVAARIVAARIIPVGAVGTVGAVNTGHRSISGTLKPALHETFWSTNFTTFVVSDVVSVDAAILLPDCIANIRTNGLAY